MKKLFRKLFGRRRVVIDIAQEVTEDELRGMFAYPKHQLLCGLYVVIAELVSERINLSLDPGEDKDAALGGIEGLMALQERVEGLVSLSSQFDAAEGGEPELEA